MTALELLSVILAFLTGGLVVLTIVLILTSRAHTRIVERLFRVTKVDVGASIYETNMQLPLEWLKEDINSLLADLNKLDEVKAGTTDGKLKLLYLLNQEERVLQVLKENSKEPEKIESKIRYFTKL